MVRHCKTSPSGTSIPAEHKGGERANPAMSERAGEGPHSTACKRCTLEISRVDVARPPGRLACLTIEERVGGGSARAGGAQQPHGAAVW